MKTTIDLPEDVLAKAKIVAATRSTTLRELVLQGLKLMTETPPQVERKEREAAPKGAAMGDAGEQYRSDGSPEAGGNRCRYCSSLYSALAHCHRPMGAIVFAA
ncbi:MAG: hypothetical protein ABL994_02325 [Verrucomicrobiales bacterium]